MESNMEKISVTLPPDQIQWIDEQVKKQVYANRSHAIRVAIQHLKQETA